MLLFVSLAGPAPSGRAGPSRFFRLLRPPSTTCCDRSKVAVSHPTRNNSASRRTHSVGYSVASGAPPRCWTARCQPLQVACSAEVVAMLAPGYRRGAGRPHRRVGGHPGAAGARGANGSAVGVRTPSTMRSDAGLRNGRQGCCASGRGAGGAVLAVCGVLAAVLPRHLAGVFIFGGVGVFLVFCVLGVRRRASGPPDPCCERAHTRRSLADQVFGP